MDKELDAWSPKHYDEQVWYNRVQRDFGSAYVESRPYPMLMYRYYLAGMATNYIRGKRFCRKAIRNVHKELDENMSSLCELALSGDIETAKFQIKREREKFKNDKNEEKKEYTIDTKENNSVLHYAVLSGSIEMAKFILLEVKDFVNRKDLVTNFSPFHYALFSENLEMMDLLIRHKADVEQEDSFNGHPFDYGKMLGLLPPLHPSAPSHVRVYNRLNKENPALEMWEIPKLEKYFNIQFCPQIRCTHDYIVELMFSGFQIEKDTKFRDQYGEQIYRSSGDENVILSWISDEVGWGVYAGKDFNAGDYILRYGGDLIPEEKVKNKDYNMMVSFEDYVLTAYEKRNMGGFVNHSLNFNAETQCIFERGAEQAIITATEFIPRGKQILIDYSSTKSKYLINKRYWGEADERSEEKEKVVGRGGIVSLALSDAFPTFLPATVFDI